MRIVLLGLVMIGCGSDSESSLSCEYLASPDNCWKTTATTAVSCLPPDGAIGVLAADNASCTYASGQVITFASPLTLPLPQNPTWDFTVTTNGTECLQYSDSNDGFELTVGSDTVSEELSGPAGLALTCPDGTRYANSNALDLLSCPDSNLGNLPGSSYFSSDTSVHFALINAGGTNTLTVFDCQR